MNFTNRNFIRKHLVSFAIIIFVAIYVLIVKLKPGFLYNNDGSYPTFGDRYKNKTVNPICLLAKPLPIASY